MYPEIQAFAAGFAVTLLHAAVTLVLLVAGVALYGVLSPHREVQLIGEGNTAAAISFAGQIVALAIPLAAALHASTSLGEIAIWGVGILAVQLLIYRLVDMALSGLPQRIREGETAAAALLVAAKLAAALVLAAAVAG
jgi:putative membrane protein